MNDSPDPVSEPTPTPDIIVPPPYRSFSRENLVEEAKKYMRDTYGVPRDMSPEEQDRYHTRLGMLVDFIHTIML